MLLRERVTYQQMPLSFPFSYWYWYKLLHAFLLKKALFAVLPVL
jgi:hypothetical protein